MTYTIGLVPVSKPAAPVATILGPAPVPPAVPLEYENIRAAIQLHIDNLALPLAVGRTRDRQAAYAALLQDAFYVVVPIPGPDLLRPYSLDPNYLTCVVLPDGHWGYTVDGISMKVEPVPAPVNPAGIDPVEYYLTITPTSVAPPEMLFLAMSAAEGSYALAGSSTCTFTLQNTTGVTGAGLTLYLSHARSWPLNLVVNKQRIGQTSPITHDPAQAMVHISLANPVSDKGVVELSWTFKGDPPHVRAHTWWGPADPDVTISSSSSSKPPSVIPVNEVGTLSFFSRTVSEEFELRRNAIKAIVDRTRQYRDFFFDLDQKTQPGLVTTSGISLLTGYLRSRYMLRAEDAGFGDPVAFDDEEIESWRSDAVRAADLVEKIVRDHFTGPDGALQLDRIDEAFELFAGGQLTDFDTHGAPNGVNFFAFCEFAILCVELQHKEQFWGDLIPIFARTSEIFARCYHEPCGKRTSCAYRVGHNPTGARGFSLPERAALRATWQAVAPPIEGFARIVHAALDDELFLGPVPPFGLVDKHDGVPPKCPPVAKARRSIDVRVMPTASA
jgi:hypothetical protein